MPEAERRADAPLTWSIRTVLDWATKDFRRRGFDSPRLDAEVLLSHVLRLDRVRLIVEAARPLSADELAAYRAAIQRRRRAEPVAYIVGQREFYGLSFRVDSRVLVPRPDTETLVSVALDRTRARGLYGRALDLCTGSGCVAIAFKTHRRTWDVTGTDRSAEAIAVARDNALRLGVPWGTRLLLGDLDAPLDVDERFDLVTANPPYVPTADVASLQPDIREHEPRLALDGGPDGLEVTRRIAGLVPSRLASGGIVAVEVGQGQAPAVATMLREAGCTDIECRKDYGGIERVVSGRRG